MVGRVDEDHAHKDVDDAIAMGLDGFVLNIGYPQAPFVYPTLLSLYGYTEYQNSLGKNFKLIISMDLCAAGCIKHPDGTNVDAFDYGGLFGEFLTRSGTYRGPNGKPMVTTFSDGGMHNDRLIGWKRSLNNNVYFVPDLGGTNGFATGAMGWWNYWGNVIDGVASWEYAWPKAGSGVLGSVAPDTAVRGDMTAHGKTYMMPLGALQYKNAHSTNIYRAGGLNMIKRMDGINSMSTMADWVQIISWNDGPESHYIGNIWPESNGDAEPAKYVSSTKAPHTGWQGVISSFITAYKNGDRRLDQWRTRGANPSGADQVGAMWYKTIRTSASCNAPKPIGYEVGTDKIAYAIVSNGGVLTVKYGGQSAPINLGLNYGEFDIVSGSQRMELWEGSTLKQVANGGRGTYDYCVDGIYNMNPEVVSFKTSWGGDGGC